MKPIKQLFCIVCVISYLALSSCASKTNIKKLEDFQELVVVNEICNSFIAFGNDNLYSFAKPIVEKGVVYINSVSGSIKAMDSLTCDTRWKFKVDAITLGSMSMDEKYIYLPTLSKGLFVVDKTKAKLIKNFKNLPSLISPPLINEDNLLLQSTSDSIININKKNGGILWKVSNHNQNLSLISNKQPVSTKEYLLVGLSNGKIILLNKSTGEKLRWGFYLGNSYKNSTMEKIVDVNTSILLSNSGDSFYAIANKGGVVKISASNLQKTWINTKINSALPIYESYYGLVVGATNSAIYSLNTDTGKVQWKNTDLLNRNITQPVVVGSNIIVGDSFGFVHILSLKTGKIIGRKRLSTNKINPIITVNGSHAYLTDSFGYLFVVSLNTNKKI
jgi:outer membrane protein assembly factor BamB